MVPCGGSLTGEGTLRGKKSQPNAHAGVALRHDVSRLTLPQHQPTHSLKVVLWTFGEHALAGATTRLELLKSFVFVFVDCLQ